MNIERFPPSIFASGGKSKSSDKLKSFLKVSSRSETSIAPSKTFIILFLSSMFILSAPTAKTISLSPDFISLTANEKAVDADAQAFSTFTTGMSSMPIDRSATCPGIIC